MEQVVELGDIVLEIGRHEYDVAGGTITLNHEMLLVLVIFVV